MVNQEIATSLTSNAYYIGKQFFLATLGYRQDADPQSSSSSIVAPSSLAKEGAQEHPGSTEYLVYNWLEALFAEYQMIVLWHDPIVSSCAISGLLTSYLLLTNFAPSFYATVMIALFVHNLIKVWFRHVWPEIRVPPGVRVEEEQRLDIDRFTPLHPQLMTLNELKEYTNNLTGLCDHYIQKLLTLRREKPVLFCLLICYILSCTATIGNLVSGSTILFCIVTAILIAPGIYSFLLPNAIKSRLDLIIFPSDQDVPAERHQETTHQDLQSDPEPIEKSSGHPMSLFSQLMQLALTKSTYESYRKKSPLLDSKESSVAKDQDEFPMHNFGNKDLEEENRSGITRESSDDLSSDKSTSLIDIDEVEKDDFVIL